MSYQPFAQPSGGYNNSATQNKPAITPKNLKDVVENLVFEGGGGRGMAYLGAIAALEDWKILPLKNEQSPIKGIAGASAGSIIAFLLAMGYSAEELAGMMPKFGSFLDELQFDDFPKVVWSGTSYVITRQPKKDQELPFLFADKVALLALRNLDLPESIKKKIMKPQSLYGNELMRYGALFPGFSIVDFFSDRLIQKATKINDWKLLLSSANYDANETMIKRYLNGDKTYQKNLQELIKSVTFMSFYTWLGDNTFVVAGTNLTRNEPRYFSHIHCPQFPVIAAVRLSMSIPVLFKPVYIDPGIGNLPYYYQGYWCDGGVLNNLPMHAFNREAVPLKNKTIKLENLTPYEYMALPFNVRTYGFDLVSPSKGDEIHNLSLPTLFSSLMNTFMYAGSDGQTVRPIVAENVIKIGTGELSTYELVPSAKQVVATLVGAWCVTSKKLKAMGISIPGADKSGFPEPTSLNKVRAVLGVKLPLKAPCASESAVGDGVNFNMPY